LDFFSALKKRINESQYSSEGNFKIGGLGAPKYLYYLYQNELKESSALSENQNVLIFAEQEDAENAYDTLKNHATIPVILLPSFDHSPYGGHIASERILFDRFSALSQMAQLNIRGDSYLLISTMEGLHGKVPGPNEFLEANSKIEVSDIISPNELKRKLVELGYQSSITVEEPGSFSSKGEIFDIYPVGARPIRIHYFDDMIEEIFKVDKQSLKTLRDFPLEKVTIFPTPRYFCSDKFSQNLRSNIPMPPPGHKTRFEKRKNIFSNLQEGFLFDGYASYLPLFLESPTSILKHLKNSKIIFHIFNQFRVLENWEGFLENLEYEHDLQKNNNQSDCLLPSPQSLFYYDLLNEKDITSQKRFINDIEISTDLNEEQEIITVPLVSFKDFLKNEGIFEKDKRQFLEGTFKLIRNYFKYSGNILFFYSNEAARKEFLHLCEIYEVPKEILERVTFDTFPIENGFFYTSEKLLALTEGDLFSVKKQKVKQTTQQDLDLFAEQIATLQVGDYVIHNDHGIGKYLGMKSLDLSEDKSDFLVIEYTGKDKVYVPVYKMNLIQKHANNSASIRLDSLRTNKFAALKKRASQSIKKLAFDLLKLQAERESSQAFSFSPPDHYFKEFELAFEFQETNDQRAAIQNVLNDMQKAKPMDHLVCGDVGFGKTEVAIRAAFKAVIDKKQVAVLVPTTILALQHFTSFIKRLKNFPVNVEFLSRFKTAKESKEIMEKLERGEIDIIIGTHKLLSDKIKFQDLGLVVVDEEQRFGVNHKEKLKLLKANVDFLTLTATPIPRTLQLSFLGLRDLSLIKTPPPKRQSIKTYIIKEDPLTLQTAIKKELGRGGQVFIVHNKVNDIEDYSNSIRELVPDAKIVIGHGQLPEKELEKRITAFYRGEYQILIATTIIESGIDIPNANTMIIDRADTYGLSQLHQLRGRIGRSDKKAYAYFIIPNTKILSTIAEKRLKALQTYAEMGSGFNIASCDLEIRGAGDILGAHQSGHIEAIGLELYMELLQDAIKELKGEKATFNKNIEIISPFPSFIPNHYIEDSSERLKQYKRLSNARSKEQIEDVLDELNDIYGPITKEILNLKTILQARIILSKCAVNHVQLNSSSISLKFDKELLDKNSELAGNIASTFLANPKVYHFSPDYKVLYKSKNELNQEAFLEFCHKIAEQIVPC